MNIHLPFLRGIAALYLSLLVWGSNNDLHEIEILFPKEAVAKTPKTPQEPAKPKEEEKKPSP